MKNLKPHELICDQARRLMFGNFDLSSEGLALMRHVKTGALSKTHARQLLEGYIAIMRAKKLVALDRELWGLKRDLANVKRR